MTLLLATLAGCDGTGPDGPNGCDVPDDTELDEACACEEPAVRIGGGEDTFEAVEDGSPAIMVHGPQGGWHVLGSAWFENLTELVTIDYWIDVPSLGATVVDNAYRVVMVRDGTCAGYYPGMYGYLDVSDLAEGEADTPPEILAGLEMVLHMNVEDSEGRTASDELSVVATPDPVDVDTGG
ncbi:MAG: hypothetical protein ACOZNI_18000 [Myxococcota bacterium]